MRIEHHRIDFYVRELPLAGAQPALDPELHLLDGPLEHRAAFCLTLDAINFGSGWFPTIRKRPGRSGYGTVAGALRDHFAAAGPWSPAELARLEPIEVARALGQDPGHELIPLWTDALRSVGARVERAHHGDWLDVLAAAGGSAVGLVELLADWDAFADVSLYEDRPVPFYKRAQITAADLHHAGVVDFHDLDHLTMFADNLVPHVLRLDGVLTFSDDLAARIEAGVPIEHGSPEEVEIRAAAVHAVELLVDAGDGTVSAAEIDYVLWNRGGEPAYKGRPRHRSRTTAY